jgi:UDP-glucose 6-dehydrogenase
MNIGIIGIGNFGLNLLNFLSEQQHEIYVSDVDGDNVEVIRNSDIIFCCVDTNILPSNFLDITNVMAVVEDFGFDGCIDYKNESIEDGLSRLCPNGIDGFFDNVGGPTMDAVL